MYAVTFRVFGMGRWTDYPRFFVEAENEDDARAIAEQILEACAIEYVYPEITITPWRPLT